MANKKPTSQDGEYHEPFDLLPEHVKDEHRILRLLGEEIEAIDWYNQRAAVTIDEDALGVFEHARGEEIEHAVMALEWLRRHMPEWGEAMQKILFSENCIGDKCLRRDDVRRARAARRRLDV